MVLWTVITHPCYKFPWRYSKNEISGWVRIWWYVITFPSCLHLSQITMIKAAWESSQYKDVVSIGIPMSKVRRSRNRLIFNMGIPITGKDGLHIETGPWSFYFSDLCWAVNTSSDWYGYFQWPNTHAGHRVYVQCPYADPAQDPVYGSRVCAFNGTDSYWLPEVIDTCPGRPLSEANRRARAELYPETPVGGTA